MEDPIRETALLSPPDDDAVSNAEPALDQTDYGNLTFYLRRMTQSFTDKPFTPPDSLILSSLIYLDFEEYPLSDITGFDRVALIDFLRFTPYEHMVAGSWLKEGNDVAPFLDTLARSPRFKDLAVSFYQNEKSENFDKQFCAATFTAEGMPPYIAYRGTDGSVRGWKEDFDLAYKEIIPSHQSALRYLSGALSSLPPDTMVNIGGHSKGGNLAEYAAAVIDDAGFARIEALYNHDGPNFLQDPSPRYRSAAYRKKRRKYVPESSVFGMILEYDSSFRIVRSSAATVFQHRPLTWIVADDDFAYQDELNTSAQLFDETLDKWLKSCSPKQRELFLTTIFDLVMSTDAKSWEEFQRKLVSNMARMVKEGRNLDDETKEVLINTLSRLGGVLRKTTTNYFTEKIARVFPRNTNV